ncbi:hypothetical protein D5H75_22620 [Bailinhaonella thermotolerans]|uniref:P/Homo B domain-containing protein n=2 Tax=Bailinhaonella thermotolerans TaxID=1070861 RepID=A0A3A4AQ56_9ACTN|nr:hypothetical protein D5H75_22620 [Bailinhaonella thermotolerans]
MGAYLGMTSTRIPCGGSAGSNHVHFGLKQGGSFVPLQDKVIGGWTYYEGSSAYGGGARRGGTSVGVRGLLRNYGPEDGRYFENTTNHTIPDQGQVESPITVSGVPGNAPSRLSVYVDVHHTWIGDVTLDLVAPDGTAYRMKGPDPDDDGDILHETYTVDASAEVANGVWRLRAADVSVNDSGYIDAWNLTF